VQSVAFSPVGKTLASGSIDLTIRLWDVATHQQVGQPLTGPANWAQSVAFSPDSKTLATGGFGTIRLWDVTTHQQVGQPLTGHANVVWSLAFSPDGKTLASAGSVDGTIRLWDVATHQQVGQPLTDHMDAVYSVAFSPDGKTLASGSADHLVRLWDLDVASWMKRACSIANRNLTAQEWTQYLGDAHYRQTCPGVGVPVQKATVASAATR
jgi:WD40 repeat protein